MADVPAPARLRELLVYNALTGELTWKPRGVANWDARYAGTPALTALSAAGYRHGLVEKAPVKAHRVAWAIYFDKWPTEIDHINGEKADNRILNLREVTRRENSKNRSLRSDNQTGAVGISERRGKWLARIQAGDKNVCLGTFATKDEAIAARARAQVLLGYHENHGRRA
jgi:hypothetical protein